MSKQGEIICGDSLEVLRGFSDESVDCCITSPPYFGLRDYGVDGQIGLEETPKAYVQKLVEVFREVKRVLKKEGTLWLNLGDSYNGTGGGQKNENSPKQLSNRGATTATNKDGKHIFGLKPKDLIGIPWRVAFALQADGWWLRQDIIWAKPNPMPESVTDRCTKAHEYIFLLSKSPKYYFDAIEIMEPSVTQLAVIQKRKRKNGVGIDEGKGKNGEYGFNYGVRAFRNKRSVWTITTKPFKEAHFATFPEALIEPMVLAGCPKGGLVCDPFFGAGTTGVIAKKLGRNYLGVELNPEYIKIAQRRIDGTGNPFL